MTFLEKYKKDHPNDNEETTIEYFCPYEFGYEEDIECKIPATEDLYICRRCWEREMPRAEPEMVITKEDLNAMYNQGCNDAWALAKSMVCEEDSGGIPCDKMKEIYGTSYVNDVFLRFTYQEAMKAYDAYARRCSELRAGDVVMHDTYGKILVTKVEMQRYIEGLLPDGSAAHVLIKDVKRTGNHVNIAPILGIIGG